MKTHVLFLPNDHTAIEMESSQTADEVVEKVRAGLWTPPASYARRAAWRAIRQGQRVIILPEADNSTLVNLSPRQLEVLAGLAEGLTLKELALHMNISLRTLCGHITQIKLRLGTTTLAQSTSRAAELGIYPPAD